MINIYLCGGPGASHLHHPARHLPMLALGTETTVSYLCSRRQLVKGAGLHMHKVSHGKVLTIDAQRGGGCDAIS